jgi:hypothetical protein
VTDERLQRAYARVLAERTRADRAGCLTPENLVSLVERRLPEEERLRTLDHVMACALCRKEFELLRSVTSAQREAAARRRMAPALALAASILVVVGAGVLWRTLGAHNASSDTLRGPTDQVELISGGTLAGQKPSFTWKPVPRALHYTVEVLDTAGTAVFSAMTTDTTLALPDSVTLVSGGQYRWWVQATLLDGKNITSPAVPLQMRSR